MSYSPNISAQTIHIQSKLHQIAIHPSSLLAINASSSAPKSRLTSPLSLTTSITIISLLSSPQSLSILKAKTRTPKNAREEEVQPRERGKMATELLVGLEPTKNLKSPKRLPSREKASHECKQGRLTSPP